MYVCFCFLCIEPLPHVFSIYFSSASWGVACVKKLCKLHYGYLLNAERGNPASHTHTHTCKCSGTFCSPVFFFGGFSRLAKSKLLPLILFAPKFGFPCLLFFFWVSGFFFFFVGFFHGAVGPAGAFPFRHLQARTSGKMINYFVYLPFGNHFRSERGTNLYRWPIDGWQNEGAAPAIIVF